MTESKDWLVFKLDVSCSPQVPSCWLVWSLRSMLGYFAVCLGRPTSNPSQCGTLKSIFNPQCGCWDDKTLRPEHWGSVIIRGLVWLSLHSPFPWICVYVCARRSLQRILIKWASRTHTGCSRGRTRLMAKGQEGPSLSRREEALPLRCCGPAGNLSLQWCLDCLLTGPPPPQVS